MYIYIYYREGRGQFRDNTQGAIFFLLTTSPRFLYFLFLVKHSRAGKRTKVEVVSCLDVSLDLLFLGLLQPAPPPVDLNIWKIIRCSL